MKNIFIAAVALLASTSAVLAGTKSFIINGTDMVTANGGAVSGAEVTFEGLSLADSSFSSAVISFVLPKDYKKNTPVTIRVRLFGGGTSCTVRLFVGAVRRAREGASTTTDTASLTSSQPDLFTRPADFELITGRNYVLKKIGAGPVISGTIRDQKAGDVIAAILTRQGGADSCTNVVIFSSAKITYTTN